jgi:hypothetical protein
MRKASHVIIRKGRKKPKIAPDQTEVQTQTRFGMGGGFSAEF